MYPESLVNHKPIINLNQNRTHRVNLDENLMSFSSNGNSKIKNSINSTTTTIKSSRKPPVNSFTKRFSTQDRLSLDTRRSTPLFTSCSVNSLQDRIRRERKAHTMAPLLQISGPSSTPQAKLFASIPAPIDNYTNKLNHPTEKMLKNSFQKPDIERTEADTPVIVKVRYDPQTGVLPSEDAVRKAIDKNIFHNKIKNNPIVIDFSGQNIQSQLPNHFPSRIPPKPSRTFPSAPHPFLHKKNTHSEQAPKPFIKKQEIQSRKIPQLPKRKINSSRINKSNSKVTNTVKSNHQTMASQQSSTVSRRPDPGVPSNEVFRPPSVKDIPELSQENLLNMLNQIPDLRGRRFNIEYAPPTAPEGYPFPSNLDPTNNTYPEPVVIDQLPTNIIQHVRNSNNPAITAALEATIQQEQRFQSQPTIMHHTAQPRQQVQQSRSISSNNSASSTEVSSSETSSSDNEEVKSVPSTKPANNIPFVGPTPPKSNQYR